MTVQKALYERWEANANAVARGWLHHERGASAAEDERHWMLRKPAARERALRAALVSDPENRLSVRHVDRNLRGTCAAHVEFDV
jgi:hypothetical protein